ncbi:MAG: hypothetical protein KGN77_05240 [Xanthomonadaceae bacterium]|nr:hypothetical protein [Xanthomonadaceae bacterium]
MVVSTDAPVRTVIEVDGEEQPWDEILEHGPESVDFSAARAVLFHHDPKWILGSVRSSEVRAGQLFATTAIDPAATLPSNVNALKAVRDGALKGTSLKYSYRADDPEHATIDFETRTVRVHKWRALEYTLTAMPADPAAGVRSLTNPDTRKKTMPAAANADPKGGTPDNKTENKATEAEITLARTAANDEAKEVAKLVEGHGFRSSDYIGLSKAAAQTKLLDAIAERDKKAGGDPQERVRSHIEVGEEHQDKLRKRFEGAILWQAGFRHTDDAANRIKLHDKTKLVDLQEDNDLRGLTITEMARATLEGFGIRTGSMGKRHLAAWLLSRKADLMGDGFRNAANTQTGYFLSFTFLNIMKKAVALGFQMGLPTIRYQPLVARNYVPDYKQFAVGGLGVSNLQQTVENAAFPELTKAEGVYLDNIKMWGGTISLSEQAIVSDDTGRFMEQLRQAGVISQKTRDKRAFQKLLMGISTTDGTATWTGNVTTGATIVATTNDQVIAARANLAKVEAALMSKVGLDGNPTGNQARFLILPPTLGTVATGLMGISPGQQNQANFRYETIVSPWLEFTGLAGYNSSNYYLVADPNIATGLILTTLMGQDEPRVEQYDPGAVAAFKWKIYDPFEVGMGVYQHAGGTYIAGIQQGTP